MPTHIDDAGTSLLRVLFSFDAVSRMWSLRVARMQASKQGDAAPCSQCCALHSYRALCRCPGCRRKTRHTGQLRCRTFGPTVQNCHWLGAGRLLEARLLVWIDVGRDIGVAGAYHL